MNDTNQLEIQNGDFVVERSEYQHVQHLLEAYPGHYRQHPQVGIGVKDLVSSSLSRQAVRQRVRKGLLIDRALVDDVKVSEDIASAEKTIQVILKDQ